MKYQPLVQHLLANRADTLALDVDSDDLKLAKQALLSGLRRSLDSHNEMLAISDMPEEDVTFRVEIDDTLGQLNLSIATKSSRLRFTLAAPASTATDEEATDDHTSPDEASDN